MDVGRRFAGPHRDAGVYDTEPYYTARDQVSFVLERSDQRGREDDGVATRPRKQTFAQRADGAERSVDAGAAQGRERRLKGLDEALRRARAKHRQHRSTRLPLYMIRLCAGDLDDTLPLGDVLVEVATEFLRRHHHRARPLLRPFGPRFGTIDDL